MTLFQLLMLYYIKQMEKRKADQSQRRYWCKIWENQIILAYFIWSKTTKIMELKENVNCGKTLWKHKYKVLLLSVLR
jgi:hypothetical protein